MSINKTSLLSSRTQSQLKSAIKAAVRASNNGEHATRYITNAKGENYLRVTHTRGIGGGLVFWSHNSTNVTKTVKSALQAAA